MRGGWKQAWVCSGPPSSRSWPVAARPGIWRTSSNSNTTFRTLTCLHFKLQQPLLTYRFWCAHRGVWTGGSERTGWPTGRPPSAGTGRFSSPPVSASLAALLKKEQTGLERQVDYRSQHKLLVLPSYEFILVTNWLKVTGVNYTSDFVLKKNQPKIYWCFFDL